MKKIIFLIAFLLAICYPQKAFASEMDETMKSQEEALGISGFLKEAEGYTRDVFEDIDINSMYKNAISGNIDTGGVLNAVLKIAGTEVQSTIRTIGYILVIIIVHSIIKNITEGLGNGEIGEITYYVQYILIVTLVMTNFSDIIVLIKETTNNLVGFLNSLLPILLALMAATGNLVTVSTVQPVLLMLITFIGNTISAVFLPLILVRNITWNNLKNIR